jgi:hypothetical protein
MMHAVCSGEGPPMYWYGWIALALPSAAIVGWAQRESLAMSAFAPL